MMFKHFKSVLGGLSLLGVLAQSGTSFAQNDVPTPFVSKETHLGVASCAGSSCHGALEPWTDSTVLQNEYILWEEEDPHSGAYATLLTAESQRIARNLG